MNFCKGASSGAEACAAAQMRVEIDQTLNAGAIEEAAQATHQLRVFRSNELDDGGASPYLKDDVTFVPQTVDCGLCGGEAVRFDVGMVMARNCLVSGSCELSWAKLHPQAYLNKTGKPIADILPCIGSESRCTASIKLEQGEHPGTLNPILIGRCLIETEGNREKWEGVDIPMLNAMQAEELTEGRFEEFDGQQ